MHSSAAYRLFHRTHVPVIACFHQLHRSVFAEDVKKQDTVHFHLITNDKNIPATKKRVDKNPSKVVKEIHESARRSKDSI